MNPIVNELVKNSLFVYSKAKSLTFALQYLTLLRVSASIPGFKSPVIHQEKDLLLRINREIDALFRKDIEQIQEGYFPLSVLKPEAILRNLNQIPKVMVDSFWIGNRRNRGRTTEFTSEARSLMEGLPRYYQRNFHFQTDGYLSRRSAEVYDYEVDLLFSGTTDAMRRLVIAPMKRALNSRDGAGMKFLEIGAGTGSATRFVKMAFPKAKIVAVDLSDPYLKLAQRRLAPFAKVGFLQADGAELPFQSEEFDAVYSVFLFHELPHKARLDVLKESFRVLKKGGFMGFVDSIQKGDQPEFDILLDEFPENFHEPFFRNYASSPMEALIQPLTSSPYQGERGFFSKVGFVSKQ